MIAHRSSDGDGVQLDLSGAEARVLLEELSDVRGGARMPKLRQVCRELELLFALPVLIDRRNKKKEKKR